MSAYFAGTLLLLQLTMGASLALLTRALSGGAWGEAFIESLARLSRLAPAACGLFALNLFWLSDLFRWPTHRELLQGHAQETLMTPMAFGIRTLVILAAFTWISIVATRAKEARPSKSGLDSRVIWSAALIVLFFTATVGALDWFFDPTFTSSIEGVLFLSGGFVAAIALALLKAPNVETRPYLKGNLLFTGCCAWAYLVLSRLMVTYMGFEPTKLSHLTLRAEGDYKPVTFTLWALQWVLPFLILFFRPLKRQAKVLVVLSIGVLAARALDIGDTLLLPPTLFALALAVWLAVCAALWRFA